MFVLGNFISCIRIFILPELKVESGNVTIPTVPTVPTVPTFDYCANFYCDDFTCRRNLASCGPNSGFGAPSGPADSNYEEFYNYNDDNNIGNDL